MITDSRSNLAPSTKGCNKLEVLGLAGTGYMGLVADGLWLLRVGYAGVLWLGCYGLLGLVY